MKDINFMVTIARRRDETEYTDFFMRYGIPVVYATTCNGTTNNEKLNLLGIEQTEKSVLFTVVTRDTARYLMGKMRSEMYIDMPDRGIAVALPINSFGGSTALDFYTGKMITTEKETKDMPTDHELIVAISQKGTTDLVMNAARSAGAKGGTVIHAKGTGSENVQKFFGVSIAEEKEMIFIVTKVDLKKDIVKAIMQNAGINSPAHSLVFSLPVNEAAGFQYEDEA